MSKSIEVTAQRSRAARIPVRKENNGGMEFEQTYSYKKIVTNGKQKVIYA